MTLSFVSFAFLFSSPSSFKLLYVFDLNTTKSAVVFLPNSSFINPITFFMFSFR